MDVLGSRAVQDLVLGVFTPGWNSTKLDKQRCLRGSLAYSSQPHYKNDIDVRTETGTEIKQRIGDQNDASFG
jgi:hypothetical protein